VIGGIHEIIDRADSAKAEPAEESALGRRALSSKQPGPHRDGANHEEEERDEPDLGEAEVAQ